MKTCLVGLGALLVVLGLLSLGFAQQPLREGSKQVKTEEEDESSVWMKKKLEFSQKLLAALTKGDFDKITANAQAMNFMDFLEKRARGERAEYKRQMSHFE